ncbi:hypothetical protein GCM10009841_12170 [Microlunatus panaciterrae]
MVTSLKKFREVAAFVLLGALALTMLMGLVSLIYLATLDGYGFASASAVAGDYFSSAVLVVLLTLVVASCVLVEPTPHARLLTLLSLIAVGGGVLLSLLFAVIGLAAPGGPTVVMSFFAYLAGLAPAVLAAIVLFRLLQGQPAQVRQRQAAPGYPQGQLGGPYAQPGYHPQSGRYPGSDQGPGQVQPTWQPDQASGASWQTAGHAASGASASSWGAPGDTSGWNAPSAGQPSASQPTAGSDWQPQHAPQQPYSPIQPAQPGQARQGQFPPAQQPAQNRPAQNQPAQNQPAQNRYEQHNPESAQETRVLPVQSQPSATGNEGPAPTDQQGRDDQPGQDWWSAPRQ